MGEYPYNLVMPLKSWFRTTPPVLPAPDDWILPLPPLADGRTPTERFLPLQGGVNFRDIGGYETADGRAIRAGQVYRAGVLSHLTPTDQQLLGSLGIRLVCDLRTASEVQKRPDKLPNNPECQWRHLPAESLERSARWRGLAAMLFHRAELENLMDEGYTRVMIDDNALLIGQVLRLLADAHNRPIIIHCSAGKDRTAVIIALLLHILGIPQETILADYTLSNRHYQKYRDGIAQDIHHLRHLGITADHLQAVILVKASRLQKMMTHIQQTYGSVEQYLQQQAGLDEQTMQQLRSQLLAEVRTGRHLIDRESLFNRGERRG